jgi:hypothetical protein
MADASYSDGDDDGGFADDYNGDYTLEEFDIGPSDHQIDHKETSSIDFRMGAPPPERSLEARLRDASDAAPQGMQLARDAGGPGGCDGGNTGVKGVKADFEAAKQVMRNERLMASMRKDRMLNPQPSIDIEQLEKQKNKEIKKKEVRRVQSAI